MADRDLALGLRSLFWTNADNDARVALDEPMGSLGAWWMEQSCSPPSLLCAPSGPQRPGLPPSWHCSYYHCLQGALNWGHNLRGNEETNNRFLKAQSTSESLCLME